MEITGYLSAVLIGIVIGVLARVLLPGRQRIGAILTVLIGIGAAALGSYVAHRFGLDNDHPAHWWRLSWDWVLLGIQVAFALVGIGLASALAHTVIAEREDTAR
ncbi:GlsB/YeaQ/YmgE family stress response membrane protein [Plantactinospora siamensis]|uniref:GlsB/YeaQ/YmgE family stress response membrane protein n=1 Tax=Plantactinospora siamensis TaxID=555372 RepID=A0ABV6P0I4_9ACTN